MAAHDEETLALPPRKARFSGPLWPLWWYLEWAIPGLGMFSEAYIIFCESSASSLAYITGTLLCLYDLSLTRTVTPAQTLRSPTWLTLTPPR